MSEDNLTIDISILPVKRQASLKECARCFGVALHSGEQVRLQMRPTPIGSGIRFIRTDVTDRDNIIPVRADSLTNARRCTTIGNPAGIEVSMIEHLMAALSASGIDNLDIEVNANELPAMDGSAEPYLKLFEQVGLETLEAPRRYVKVLKSIEIETENGYGRIDPCPALQLDVTIDFDDGAIGRQHIRIEPDVREFRSRLAAARTFARLHEVAALREAGLSKGGSLDNAVVVDGDDVLNPEGLRYSDEFVRHKALDLLGDMYVGGPLLGRVTTIKAGHALNHELLLALFADASAWRFTHQLDGDVTHAADTQRVSPLEQTARAL